MRVSVARANVGLTGDHRSADYMQGTHLKFKTKEDAIHFAEKQGVFVSPPCLITWRLMSVLVRLGLLCAATNGETDTAKELQRELFVFARKDQDRTYKVDFFVLPNTLP